MKLAEAQGLLDGLCVDWGLRPMQIKPSKRLTTSGANVYLLDRSVQIVPALLRCSEAEQTIRHEFAHMLAYDLDERSPAHGALWKECCRAVDIYPDLYLGPIGTKVMLEVRTQRAVRKQTSEGGER